MTNIAEKIRERERVGRRNLRIIALFNKRRFYDFEKASVLLENIIFLHT